MLKSTRRHIMMQGSATPPEPTPQLWWSGSDEVSGNIWIDKIIGQQMNLVAGDGSIIKEADRVRFVNKSFSYSNYVVPPYFTVEIDTKITQIYGHSPIIQLTYTQWRAIAVLNGNFYIYINPYIQTQLGTPVPVGERHRYKLAALPEGKFFYIDDNLIWSDSSTWPSADGNQITTCKFSTLTGNYYLDQEIYNIKIWWDDEN